MTSEVTGWKYRSPAEKMLKEYVFNNASKLYNHYMRKILHNSLEIYFTKLSLYHPWNEVILGNFNYLVQCLKQFLLKLKQVTYIHIHYYGHTTWFKPLKTSHLQGNKKPAHNTFHFNLHSKLQINMTFYHIYFSSSSFLNCNFGSLNIKPFSHNIKKTLYDFKILWYCPKIYYLSSI